MVVMSALRSSASASRRADLDDAAIELCPDDDDDGAHLEEHQRAHDARQAGVEARVVVDGEPGGEQLRRDHPQQDAEHHAGPDVGEAALACRQPQVIGDELDDRWRR